MTSRIIYHATGGDDEEFWEWQDSEDEDTENEDSESDSFAYSSVDITPKLDAIIHLQAVSIIFYGIVTGILLMSLFFRRLDK